MYCSALYRLDYVDICWAFLCYRFAVRIQWVKWRFSTYIREIHFANDAPPPSDSVWSVDFWFRKIIKIVAISQILRLCTKFYFGWGSGLCPRPTWDSLQRYFSTGEATGVTPLFEIWVSQFVLICIEIRFGGVGRNSERDRISTKKRLKNASA